MAATHGNGNDLQPPERAMEGALAADIAPAQVPNAAPSIAPGAVVNGALEPKQSSSKSAPKRARTWSHATDESEATTGATEQPSGNAAKKKRVRRKALTVEEDREILRAVAVEKPYRLRAKLATSAWRRAAERVEAAAVGGELSDVLCRGRFSNLVLKFSYGKLADDDETLRLATAVVDDMQRYRRERADAGEELKGNLWACLPNAPASGPAVQSTTWMATAGGATTSHRWWERSISDDEGSNSMEDETAAGRAKRVTGSLYASVAAWLGVEKMRPVTRNTEQQTQSRVSSMKPRAVDVEKRQEENDVASAKPDEVVASVLASVEEKSPKTVEERRSALQGTLLAMATRLYDMEQLWATQDERRARERVQTDEVAQLKDRVSDLEVQVETMMASTDADEREKRRLKAQVATLGASVARGEREREELQRSVAFLSMSLKASEAERVELKHSVGSLSALIRDLTTITGTLKALKDSQRRHEDEFQDFKQQLVLSMQEVQAEDEERLEAIAAQLHRVQEAVEDDKRERDDIRGIVVAFEQWKKQVESTLENPAAPASTAKRPGKRAAANSSDSKIESELAALRAALEEEREERRMQYGKLLVGIQDAILGDEAA